MLTPSGTSAYPTARLPVILWLWIFLPLVAVATVSLDRVEVSRKCNGSFSADFSTEFDRVHCRLVLQDPARDAEISIPLP